MNSKMDLFSISLLLVFLMIVCQCQASNQAFTIEPEDTSAVIGSQVLLPCRVENKQGVLQWTKDDFGLGTLRNLSAFDRYTMIGNDEDGDYTLQIDSFQLEDDAKYQCQVSPGPLGEPGIRSQYAKLTVLVAPAPPRILQGDFMLTTENKELELDCVSVGGKPAATLTWHDGSGSEITEGVEQTKELLSDGKRYTVKSTLKFQVQSEHHNTTLACHATNAADKATKIADIKLEVRYAPKIKLSMESYLRPNDSNFYTSCSSQVKDSAILDGSEVHFKCAANAYPNDILYKWFINDSLVVGDYTTEMAIFSVNRSHHNAVIKCEATNDIGTAVEKTTLNVHCPPTFIETPKSIEADKGEKIILTCSADGNPVEIVWVHDPIDRINYHPKVVGTKRVHKLTVSNETAGRYFCKGNVPGFPEIKSAADVYLKQEPQITSKRQQYGIVGDTLHLECAAISIPRARHISWSFRGREIITNGDPEFSILEQITVQGIKSTLIIRNSQVCHFDKYNCSVVNDYGTDILQIDLLHAETLIRQIRANLPIFLTISVMTVIILVVIVCFVYIKTMGRKARKMKKEKQFMPHDNYMMNFSDDNSSTEKCCKDSDRSSPSSDYKIKQGSSESSYSLPSTVSDNTLLQIINNNVNTIPYEKPVAYRKSINYNDDDAYYSSKDVQNSYGSITAIKNRRSIDYDDDRYYIANNLRNSHYAMHPNPSPQNPYVQKPHVITNYPSNRYLSQVKRASLTNSLNNSAATTPTNNINDPKQDVGLPRSSIV